MPASGVNVLEFTNVTFLVTMVVFPLPSTAVITIVFVPFSA